VLTAWLTLNGRKGPENSDGAMFAVQP